MTDTSFKFLFVNLPYSGHINPTTQLVQYLTGAGHTVDYIVDSSFKDLIIESGARHIPYDDYDPEWSEPHRYAKAFEQAYKTAERVGKSGNYDCLIFEAYFIFGYKLSKELDLPTVRLFSTFAFNHDVLDTIKETGGPQLAFMDDKNPLYKLLVKYFEDKKDMMVTTDVFDEMAEGIQDLNIVYTSKSFQPRSEDFPDDYFLFVGPAIDDDQSDDTPDMPYDEMDQPIIYVAMGSMLPRFAKKIYQNCIDAFTDSDSSLILSVGYDFEESDFDHVSENIYIYSKVPQVDVLKHTDAFITHGGMNSVNEGLYFGVPMVVHPFLNDQPLIAEQLKELNTAKEMNLRKSEPDEIRETVLNLLDDEDLLQAAADQKETMQALGGNEKAGKAILDMLRKHSK
ncbi:nucleotide disphospho-sugar-binding domain-containing protein [Alkalibacterium pelagium]|uniref:Glycosyltransferase, MGT family n=1 Tax=Alkalibacterium pelagium TaxID=426702 RepID=A0A1H7NL74_9LACT|nr:nucleotide disphospho-sugar-binding domain-containing protein [Alkalibacterium pelagium]GEN51448.1 glycosyl transferase [Alkalibacterium pelagium]SEL24079.1 glycosyltransferase, MGT family [Alkalibacterium pelagium]